MCFISLFFFTWTECWTWAPDKSPNLFRKVSHWSVTAEQSLEAGRTWHFLQCQWILCLQTTTISSVSGFKEWRSQKSSHMKAGDPPSWAAHKVRNCMNWRAGFGKDCGIFNKSMKAWLQLEMNLTAADVTVLKHLLTENRQRHQNIKKLLQASSRRCSDHRKRTPRAIQGEVRLLFY